MQKILKTNAYHEAGHAVASYVTEQELGYDWNQFTLVLRTPDEIRAGPNIDRQGRTYHDLLGCLESAHRYTSFGPIESVLFTGKIDKEKVIAEWRRNMEGDVIEGLAGLAAGARFQHRTQLVLMMSNFSRSLDVKDARRKIGDFTQTADESQNVFETLFNRAWQLVRQNWHAIDALAKALLAKHVIEADEAIAIIRSAAGPAPSSTNIERNNQPWN